MADNDTSLIPNTGVRARIQFFPSTSSSNYVMGTKVILSEVCDDWDVDVSNYISNGYIYTPFEDDISTINSKYWVKFECLSGYKFESVHKTNSGGTSNSGEFELTDNDKTVVIYPWNTGTANPMYNYVYFTVTEDAETVTHDVSTELTGCSCNNKSSYDDGETVTLTVTADEGYIFESNPVIRLSDGTELIFTLNDDKTEGVITFIINDDCTVIGIAVIPNHVLHLNLTNCYCNFKDSIPHGENEVIITAYTGYELNGYIEVTCNLITSNRNDFEWIDGVCECRFTLNVESGDVYITAQAIRIQGQVSAFTNLYRVNNKILSDLSKVRFYDVQGSGSEVVDYGTFITNLISLPVELPDDIIGDTGSIQLGNYDSGVQADTLLYHTVTVDLGTISVPEKYKNVYDYKDTDCILHLPYTDDIEIPVEYVINQDLHIEYRIDLYSGNMTVNLISSFTGKTVLSVSETIGTQIPFIQVQNNSIVSQVQKIIDNGIRQAYIEVKRNIPYNVYCMFGKPTVDYGRLGDYEGYIEVRDCQIDIDCTREERDEIQQLLREGVYINGDILFD